MLNANSRDLFSFSPTETYLDHGGFGVMPKEVMAARFRILTEIEKAPGPFCVFDFRPAWDHAAALVAERFSAQAKDLALVDNVTDGINAVLRSLTFKPDDEILLTSLAYGAITNAATTIAERQGARIRTATIKFPQPDPEQAIAAVSAAITPRTKLAILDHITSGTGLVLPIIEMIKACRARNVPVLVDGAHVPGNVSLDIPALGADWYAANLHKWYFVPRGCGFLWAHHDHHQGLLTNVLSWDINNPFPQSFQWTGTRDASSWLSIPSAFDFMDRHDEQKVRTHNQTLVRQGSQVLMDIWNVRNETPDTMLGSMILLPLPEGIPFPASDEGRIKLQKALWDLHQIFVSPSYYHEGRMWVRFSAQIYNVLEDYERLARAVFTLRKVI